MVQIWKAIVNICKNEPVLVLGFASAALALAASFGLHMLPNQSAEIMAIVQVIISLIARSQTVAKAKYAALVSLIKQKAGA